MEAKFLKLMLHFLCEGDQKIFADGMQDSFCHQCVHIVVTQVCQARHGVSPKSPVVSKATGAKE